MTCFCGLKHGSCRRGRLHMSHGNDTRQTNTTGRAGCKVSRGLAMPTSSPFYCFPLKITQPWFQIVLAVTQKPLLCFGHHGFVLAIAVARGKTLSMWYLKSLDLHSRINCFWFFILRSHHRKAKCNVHILACFTPFFTLCNFVLSGQRRE